MVRGAFYLKKTPKWYIYDIAYNKDIATSYVKVISGSFVKTWNTYIIIEDDDDVCVCVWVGPTLYLYA